VYYEYHKPESGKPDVVGYQTDSVQVDFVIESAAATTGVARFEQTFSLKFLAKLAT
jgi:hypothetical protein